MARFLATPLVQLELVPPNAAAAGYRVHGVYGNEQRAVSNTPIDHPRHNLVALRIEPPVGTRLRHAVRQLPVAEVVICATGIFTGPSTFVFDGSPQST